VVERRIHGGLVFSCTTDAGVVTGTLGAPIPPIFAIDANARLVSVSDGISSGYFYAPWCNNATTACTLTMTCAANLKCTFRGSYGRSTAAPMDGKPEGGEAAGNSSTLVLDAK